MVICLVFRAFEFLDIYGQLRATELKRIKGLLANRQIRNEKRFATHDRDPSGSCCRLC